MQKQLKDNNIFSSGLLSNADNAGMIGENIAWLPVSQTSNPTDKTQKMINDVDSELILENLDKTVKNKAVKLSVKINTITKNLAKINEELELIKLLNLEKDTIRRKELSRFKDFLEMRLSELKSERKKFGVFYFIAGLLGDEAYFDNFLEKILKAKLYIINLFRSKIFPYLNENLFSKIPLRRH